MTIIMIPIRQTMRVGHVRSFAHDSYVQEAEAVQLMSFPMRAGETELFLTMMESGLSQKGNTLSIPSCHFS